MKCILLSVTLMASLAVAQQPTYDFRSASWGASVAQVKATETAKVFNEADTGGKHVLTYRDVVAELPCYVVYVFIADQLVRAKYIFTQQHTNENAFIDDFNKIKNILFDKYGQPTADLTRWTNDLYRDHPDEWGKAVAAGHLQVGAQWKTERSEILAGVKGDNFTLEHQVQYTSESLRHLEVDIDKAATDKKF